MNKSNFHYFAKLLYCFRKKKLSIKRRHHCNYVYVFRVNGLEINYNPYFTVPKTHKEIYFFCTNEEENDSDKYMMSRTNRSFKVFLKQVLKII